MLTPTKSANISSATGRSPASAAPPAAPMIADSEIGVSMTRSSPNFGSSPLVTPKMPPEASRSPEVPPAPPDTSSPSTITVGSRAISRCRASFRASRNDFCGISVAHVDVGRDVRLRGRGCALRSCDGCADRREHLGVDRIERRRRDAALRRDALAEFLQAVERLPLPFHFIFRAVELWVTLEMPVEARDGRLERGGALAAPRPLDQLAGGLVYREEVRAIAFHGRHAEAAGTAGDVPRPHGICGPRVLAVTVVLEDEDCGHLQDDGHIHGFEHRPLVRAAVAAKRHTDPPVPAIPAGDGCTHGNWRSAADDRVRAEHPTRRIGDVHRAALAVAEPVPAPVDLEHHAGHVAALGDAVTVSAMRAHHVVAIVEMCADADGNRLLPGIEVGKSGNLTRRDLDVQALLELTDGLHPPVGVDQWLGIRPRGHPFTIHRGSYRIRRPATGPIDVVVEHLMEMPDPQFLRPEPQTRVRGGVHPALHARQVGGILVEHLPDGFVAVAEVAVLGTLRPLAAVGHELEGPDVEVHAVRILGMRALTEQHQVVGVHVDRDVREDQVVVVIGELVVVEPRIILTLAGTVLPFPLLHITPDVLEGRIVVGWVHARGLHDDLDRIGYGWRLPDPRTPGRERDQVAVVPLVAVDLDVEVVQIPHEL